jgi:hypothetical protein
MGAEMTTLFRGIRYYSENLLLNDVEEFKRRIKEN